MKAFIEYCLQARVVTGFVVLLIVVGGILSYLSLGQLEDPNFSIKSAVVTTNYPGATAAEVEQEVTDRIEIALQQMTQLKELKSVSQDGLSVIKVDIQDQYWSDKLPQIWDELRKKVNNVIPSLPEGVQTPIIGDDFNFVYGFVIAVTGEGYSYRELEDYAKEIKKQLSLVENVTRVDLWGVQDRRVYVDFSQNQLVALGISPATVINALRYQNAVVDSGAVDISQYRLKIKQTGTFTSPREIADLHIRPSSSDQLQTFLADQRSESPSSMVVNSSRQRESSPLLRLGDISTIREGYIDPPRMKLRYNGLPAIGIQLAGSETANIVKVGEDLKKRLDEVVADLPIGIEVHTIAWQSDVVDTAVSGFITNLLQALVIVLVVLIIPSGLQMGLIVGIDLLLTILATFIIMALLQIPLERMSLGALIIALGMMVDNAIVVSDKAAILIRQGIDRHKAVSTAASSTGYPLLSATLIATLAFYPIYGSIGSTGEYCRTLFIVVGASLTLSWVIAMGITPLQCLLMLPKNSPSSPSEDSHDEFDTPFYNKMRHVLTFLISYRMATLGVMLGLMALSLIGFGFVKQMFFPDSSRTQLMIDYWGPYGTRITETESGVIAIENHLKTLPEILDTSSFIGAGPPRFYLPVDPEGEAPHYAQIIATFESVDAIDKFIADQKSWFTDSFPNAMVRFRKFGVGPSNTWPFELRILGPGEADMHTLRSLGQQMLEICQQSPYGKDWRLNIQNPSLEVLLNYNQQIGRWTDVSRDDIATATKRAFDGVRIGTYRENDNLIPIVARQIDTERHDVSNTLYMLPVIPSGSIDTVPLSQVIKKIDHTWENPIISRNDRRRSVSVQGAAKPGETFPSLQNSVIDQLYAMELPPGYTREWDGEAKNSAEAQKQLLPGLVPALVMMLFLILTVFNAIRPLIIILVTIPFAIVGITWGLLIFQTPFGFLALLGGMSLAGMMNKNIVVLLDTVEELMESGLSREKAIIEAAVTRARPVLLAAGTTVLGMIPLLTDIFWRAMAVTIMAGLSVGSLLSIFIVPVFYSILYRTHRRTPNAS